ncbi:hypothetical protein DDZ13_00595 [Coraliomargarita sinensis]|uniref:Flavinylation-associated cytochrome domain-containing protein n=1 Tax=Coraliomargarita sinensis TaxID=2174842 RepID=A0A317ZNI0_9BACT|nr:DUF4405 domain-containing protein [Coraliomargarita sinensis]PXA05399.1 hypothetical protein DDZ13_00595 [Coraliomargarita sinensis]
MKPGLKNPLMRVTNLLLYLSFCGLIGTGALLNWKLIPGSQGGHGLTVLDMTRHEWGDIHFWLGVVCVGTTLFHLVLNWPWLKKIASSGKAWRLVAGLATGALIIFGIYALPLQHSGNGSSEAHQEELPQGKQHRKGW